MFNWLQQLMYHARQLSGIPPLNSMKQSVCIYRLVAATAVKLQSERSRTINAEHDDTIVIAGHFGPNIISPSEQYALILRFRLG